MTTIYNSYNQDAEPEAAPSSHSHILLLMRKYIVENRRNMLMIAGCYLAIVIVSGILGAFTIEFSTHSALLFISVFYGGILLSVTASILFREMAHKDSRISVLMTPASASQKFLARLLIVFPGTLLLILTGYFLLGYSNAFSVYILYDIWHPQLYLFDFRIMDDPAWIFIATTLILEYSVYLFGSVAWPRYSFLKSCGLLWGSSTVLSILAVYTVKRTGFMDWPHASQVALLWSLDAVMLAAAIALVLGAVSILRHKTPAR